ncbi:LuxR C-terminal-related transcriptional regulator [Prescottella defluvii]|nr:LuxR C-terminal-related transcriptional regulator [Prescottella defluvii]
MRIAELAMESGIEPDPQLLVRGAEDAIAMCSLEQGARLASAAVRLGAGFDASFALGRALMWQGMGDEAESVFAEVDPDELCEYDVARWLLTRVASLYLEAGRPREAVELFERERGRITDPMLRVSVVALDAVLHLYDRRLGEAIALAREVEAAPEAHPWARASGVFAGVAALTVSGRGFEVGALASSAWEAISHGDGLLRFHIGYFEVQALTLVGRLPAAQDTAARSRDLAAGQPNSAALADVASGVVELTSGQLNDAATHLTEALAVLDRKTRSEWMLLAAVSLCQVRAAQGRPEDAAAALEIAERNSGPELALFDPLVDVARAWVAGAAGEVSAAVPRGAPRRRSGRPVGAVRGGDPRPRRGHDLRRLLDRRAARGSRSPSRRAVREGGDRAGAGTGESGRPGARRARGRVRAGGRAARRGGYVRAGRDRVLAVERPAGRVGRRGEGPLAVVAMRRCDHAGTREGGPPAPTHRSRAGGGGAGGPGLSNKDIARRLVLSVRTVEGHVYRACEKLALSRRSDLAKLVQV